MVIVKVPVQIRPVSPTVGILDSNRINRYTPAVTKVEECTKEDTGVGAAIAAGNQALNGICALLVQEARVITQARETLASLNLPHLIKLADTPQNNMPKAVKIIASPVRLLTNVKIPALNDSLLP